MTYLLDVNVLLALVDADHVSHDVAHAWFAVEGSRAFATCPIVENGFLRIISNPKYTNPVGSPAEAAPYIAGLRSHANHQFWEADISLADSSVAMLDRIRTPGQVTDTYLLALAVSRGGKLATLDRRLSPDAVVGGRRAIRLIGP